MSEIRSQATPAKDQEQELKRDLLDGDLLGNVIASDAARMARHAIQRGWSKPRTVNSATELDALAEGSVILVDAGRYGRSAWQKHANGRWCEASHCEESMTSTELRVGNLPTTVLFAPGDAG